MLRHRWAVVVAVGTVLAVSAACTPPDQGPPSHPSWTPTVLAASTAPGDEYELPLTATTEEWWAVVEQRPTTGFDASSTLLLFPRTAPHGAPVATPTQEISLPPAVGGLAMSENVLAVRHRTVLGALDQVDLYRRDGATNSWVFAATVPRGLDLTRLFTMDVSDHALVIGDRPDPFTPGDGSVLVVPIELTPTALTADVFGAQLLAPDPSWSESDRAGFGRVVATEGDTLAVSSATDHVRIFRHVGGSWAVDATLTSPRAPAFDGRFGRALDVDTGTGTARLLLGDSGGFGGFGGSQPQPGRAVLHERGAFGWNVVHQFDPRPENALGGFGFGNEVALDGELAAVGYHWVQVPGAGGTGIVDDYRVDLYHLGPTVTLEAELSALEARGGPIAGQTNAAAVGLRLAGTHLVAVGYDGLGLGGSHEYAISWDRQFFT
jgi:hypothetical protein